MARSVQDVAKALSKLAHHQGGYFTTKQAIRIGYGNRHLDYHESVGNFERVSHGLYRLPSVPFVDRDDLIRLSLWSRNQKDEPQAIVSHESALTVHELSEIIPRQIHLTVPKRFRKPVPPGCVLHKAEMDSSDIEEREGFRVSTPRRTLLDIAGSRVSQEQLDKAVNDALSRGLVRRSQLSEVAQQSPFHERLSHALRKARAK